MYGFSLSLPFIVIIELFLIQTVNSDEYMTEEDSQIPMCRKKLDISQLRFNEP